MWFYLKISGIMPDEADGHERLLVAVGWGGS
jgi:hypothetical protein